MTHVHQAAPQAERTSVEGVESAPRVKESGLHILQHALGMDQHGRIVRGGGRNHFVTGEGSDDYPACMEHVAAGRMTRRAGNALSGGDDVFHVTDAGRAWIAENSLQPPKSTRAQQRYDQFLNEDSGLTFGEWLRYRNEASRLSW